MYRLTVENQNEEVPIMDVSDVIVAEGIITITLLKHDTMAYAKTVLSIVDERLACGIKE